MKILVISPHLPAPRTSQAGERLVFELLTLLAGRHELHLVVRLHEGQQGGLGPVEKLCAKVHPVFYQRPERRDLSGLPRVVLSYWRLCRKAKELADGEAFDLIHAEWTETGFFLRKKGAMTIEAHDVLSKPMERRYGLAQGPRRVAFRLLFLLTRLMERHIYRKFRTVFVLSDYDRRYLLSLDPSLNAVVLRHPPGIGLSDRRFEREERNLLFVGAMDRGPNVEAVLHFWKDILPLVRAGVPDVQFTIAGSRPLPEVCALAEKDGNTVVTGFVDDIERCYKTAAVFVAPLLTGGGIIVKILDALASATPVVTTSIGNEGIGATPGEHLLIGDSPAEFAGRVLELLRDRGLRERIGAAGREFVAERHGGKALLRSLEEGWSRHAGEETPGSRAAQ